MRTVPDGRMPEEMLVALTSVMNVGEAETDLDVFNKAGIERLGT